MPRGDGKKNHSTNRERSHFARKKARRWKHSKSEHQRHQRRVKDQALAYWRGEADYPTETGRRK